MKRSAPLFFATATLASAAILAAALQQPIGSPALGPGAVPSPGAAPAVDVCLAEHLESSIVPRGTPSEALAQQEAAPTERAPASPAEADTVHSRAARLGQELGLSPSDRGTLSELLLQEQAKRAHLVAEWRSGAQSEAASAALRLALDDLAAWKRDALLARLGAPVADEVLRRLGRRAPPPAQHVEARRSSAGTGHAAR